MKTYHFQLVLETPPTESEEEVLFERFGGSISPAMANGAPLLFVHLEAPSMEDAIQDAVERARSMGLAVARVELDPDAVRADTL